MTPPGPQPVEEYAEAPVWLQRIFVSTYVLFCMVLGTWLVALPWTTNWFSGGIVAQWPALQQLLQHGFVRGAVSGLGLVDIWCGVLEVIHYHDRPPASPGAASQPNGNSHDGHQ